MFNKIKEQLKGFNILLDNQEKVNSNYSKEIERLSQKVDELESQVFSIKNPIGKLSQTITWYKFGRSYIEFIYSDNSKIHNIKLIDTDTEIAFYKIQIKNNTVYIGIKYVDEEENYFIVDISNDTVIKVENNSLENFDSVEWIKK